MAWFECISGGGSPTPPTPPTPVVEDYIFNWGQAGFNTGHVHTANTKIIFKASIPTTRTDAGYTQVWGSRAGNSAYNSFSLFSRFNNAEKYVFVRTGDEHSGDVIGTAGTTSAPWNNEVCIFTAFEKTLSWYREDDPNTIRTIVATNGTVNNGVGPLAIFCLNNSTSANGWGPTDYGWMKLYWFEIYESDVLVHRFVPAYNNSQYCLYDEVDETYIYDVVKNGKNMDGHVSD